MSCVTFNEIIYIHISTRTFKPQKIHQVETIYNHISEKTNGELHMLNIIKFNIFRKIIYKFQHFLK